MNKARMLKRKCAYILRSGDDADIVFLGIKLLLENRDDDWTQLRIETDKVLVFVVVEIFPVPAGVLGPN